MMIYCNLLDAKHRQLCRHKFIMFTRKYFILANFLVSKGGKSLILELTWTLYLLVYRLLGFQKSMFLLRVPTFFSMQNVVLPGSQV